tara:strand:- start:626 stop:1012 length:387 start_codon:yes stop_codon:yes gene_type:complete
MQILGVGIDIVENLRLKNLIKNKKFIDRVFSKSEVLKSKKINNKLAFFSKRFAAKEAFSKAMGSGIGLELNFKDISINNDNYGKPLIKINKKIKNIFKKKYRINNLNVHLSISDEKKYSIAIVILERL